MRRILNVHPANYHKDDEARERCWACSHPERLEYTEADAARARQLIADGFLSISNKYRRVERIRVPPFEVAITFSDAVPTWLREKLRVWYRMGVEGGWTRQHLGEVLELSPGEFRAFKILGGGIGF